MLVGVFFSIFSVFVFLMFSFHSMILLLFIEMFILIGVYLFFVVLSSWFLPLMLILFGVCLGSYGVSLLVSKSQSKGGSYLVSFY